MKKISILFSLMSVFLFSQKKWTLQQSIDYAMEHNLQIISNKYNQKIEEYNLQIAKNEHLPTINANMSNYLRFGQTQGFQGSIGRNDNFNNDLNISANILLYNGGRLEKQVEKKQYDIEISKHNSEITKNNISLQIIQQYLSVLLNKEILKVNESAVENAQKVYEKAKITTEVGTTARTILVEAEALLSREKQKYSLVEIDIKRSLFLLAQTLQLKDYHQFDIEDTDINEQIPVLLNPLEEILDKVYVSHPQILSAQSGIKSSQAQIQVIKTSFLPIISLNAGMGTFYYNSLVTDITGIDAFGNYIKEINLPKQYKNNFYQQMGLSINIPIFNKGNTKLQVQQAKISEDIAKNNLAIQIQEIKQNIQKIYFDIESYYQTYLSAKETEKSTELALDFAEKSYDAGKINIYDLNIARNNYINAKSSVIQAKYNYIYQFKILKFYTKEK